jgi:hypothetical protein
MTNRKTALVTAVILLASLPGYSQAVDLKIHTLCSDAKDYAVCINAMTGEASTPQRVITQQGVDIA